MNVWQWTCPALGTGSVLTPWARTAVSVTRAGPGVNATWTFTSAPSSSPVNTTPPVSRCRAATGVNAYLDSRGNTVKEVRLYLSSLKCKVSLRIFMYNFLGFFFYVKLIIEYKVLHFMKGACTLSIFTVSILVTPWY